MKISIGALLAVSLLFSCHAYAEVSLTTGAGYANMAKELAKTFSETSGSKVTENYGGRLPMETALTLSFRTKVR